MRRLPLTGRLVGGRPSLASLALVLECPHGPKRRAEGLAANRSLSHDSWEKQQV